MENKKYVIIVLILLCSSNVLSQTLIDKSDSIRMNSISINLFGASPLIGISYERLLTKKISIELGIGLPNMGVGTKIFPFNYSENKLIFYSGFTITFTLIPSPLANSLVSYVPLGLGYYGEKGLIFGIDLGPGIYKEYSFSPIFIPYGNVKIGKRF